MQECTQWDSVIIFTFLSNYSQRHISFPAKHLHNYYHKILHSGPNWNWRFPLRLYVLWNFQLFRRKGVHYKVSFFCCHPFSQWHFQTWKELWYFHRNFNTRTLTIWRECSGNVPQDHPIQDGSFWFQWMPVTDRFVNLAIKHRLSMKMSTLMSS